jgi:hypothetical protein
MQMISNAMTLVVEASATVHEQLIRFFNQCFCSQGSDSLLTTSRNSSWALLSRLKQNIGVD